MITKKIIEDYTEIAFEIVVASDAEKEKAFTSYDEDVYELFTFLLVLKMMNTEYFKVLKNAPLETKIETLTLLCLGWNCHENACRACELMEKSSNRDS
jgi:hypothetical protein